jgi:hypothetical protein
MRNDSRPIGEKLREIDEHARRERMVGQQTSDKGERGKLDTEEKPIAGRDPGDEDTLARPRGNVSR